jgi:hypothetical protein
MVEWSHALGGGPIYLHAADREWVMRADPAVQFWEGATKTIGPNLTLIRLGGHFDGGTVLHWAHQRTLHEKSLEATREIQHDFRHLVISDERTRRRFAKTRIG